MNSSSRGWVYHYWSMGGCILLCLLFQGSGWLTEKISTSKYSAYCVYMETVPLYVPRVLSLWSVLTERISYKKDV